MATGDDQQWTDVTSELRDTASTLGVGECVAVEGYTLFHSMSAIELMSPKMDAHCLVGGKHDDPVELRGH